MVRVVRWAGHSDGWTRESSHTTASRIVARQHLPSSPLPRSRRSADRRSAFRIERSDGTQARGDTRCLMDLLYAIPG